MQERTELINATCPECRGPLERVKHEGMEEYRCLVGHTYSARTMLAAHYEAEERALWAAIVALEEAGNLVNAVEHEFPPEGHAGLEQAAHTKAQLAQQIREVVSKLAPFPLP